MPHYRFLLKKFYLIKRSIFYVNSFWEQSVKMKENKNSIFKDWLLSSTCHGYSRAMLHQSKTMYTLWIIFSSLMAGLAFYFISHTILNFLSYEVITNIKSYDDHNIVFPTVTICNQNPFVTEFSVNYINELLMEYISTNKSKLLDIKNSLIFVSAAIFDKSDEFKKKLSFEQNKTILYCYFNGGPCSYENDFDWYFDSIYGNCYKFNPNGLQTSTQLGPNTGFYLMFYVGK